MSGEGLYERYKDALRRGHIASIQGRLEEALDAYSEAAHIAPERATPHSSAGTALLRRRRPAEALGCFEAALQLAPADEASLVGRAEALAGIDRRREAADAWTAIAEIRAGAGRLSDALDAARRSLELAESRDRRRALERLIGVLRSSEPDEPGRAALEDALRMLEGVAVAPAGTAAPARAANRRAPVRPAGPAPQRVLPSSTPPTASVGAPPDPIEVVQADGTDDRGAGAGPGEPDGSSPRPERIVHEWPDIDIGARLAGRPEPSPVASGPRFPGALDRDVPADTDIEALARAAEASLDAHDAGPAVSRLLDLATAHRRVGNRDAAIDACCRGLAVAPDNLDLHLALTELYVERGWSALAGEKLALLRRLASLGDDPEARERVAGTRIEPF